MGDRQAQRPKAKILNEKENEKVRDQGIKRKKKVRVDKESRES